MARSDAGLSWVSPLSRSRSQEPQDNCGRQQLHVDDYHLLRLTICQMLQHKHLCSGHSAASAGSNAASAACHSCLCRTPAQLVHLGMGCVIVAVQSNFSRSKQRCDGVAPCCLLLAPTAHSHRTKLQTATSLEGNPHHLGRLCWIVARR